MVMMMPRRAGEKLVRICLFSADFGISDITISSDHDKGGVDVKQSKLQKDSTRG
jgi:hypothetical protein